VEAPPAERLEEPEEELCPEEPADPLFELEDFDDEDPPEEEDDEAPPLEDGIEEEEEEDEDCWLQPVSTIAAIKQGSVFLAFINSIST
jgi:hypothetical protein